MTETPDTLHQPPHSNPPNTSQIHFWIRRVVQVIMLGTVGIAIYEHSWLTAFLTLCIICLTLLPSIVSRHFEVRIPAEIELTAILFIFAALFLGSIHGYYERFWWWDVILHLSSGFLLGILGFLLVYVLNQHKRVEVHMNPGFISFFSFTFALSMGALWEIFEFGMDHFFLLDMQRAQTGVVNTMWDLIVDAAGGATIALLGYFYLWSESEFFVERWISHFIEQNPQLFKK
ncbi:MAG: hypothetical protein ACOC0A_02515 [Planctomycetota bacterium]